MTPLQVILLFCCASVAFGRSYSDEFESALIGPSYCGNGQSVWCQNFTTAIECNSVKHCLQSVWLTQKSTYVGSCGSCESEIERIRKGIDSSTTKDVLKELLENICSLNFVTEIFRKRCEKYVDKYIDNYFNELLDLLKSDIDSAKICHILGFCSGEELPRITYGDDAVVRFKNIILHLPADFIDVDASQPLVGASKCTWGPSYWCNNLTSSADCKATSHCIQRVWPEQHFDEDNDSVCKICKDMVQQARDQLQSNETQEELREVFEGSCKLIPIREVRTECIKLADQFVPELTEMLVSEMNPTAVCTVAGLCNSAHIDSLLAARSHMALETADSCTNCTAAATAVERYLRVAPPKNVLDKMVRLCDQLSSFSDACASMVVSNFDNIHAWLSNEVHPFPVCHLSGMCYERYHRHSDADEAALQNRAETMLATADDDLPCDLCKQLVVHFKQVLTANTTEDEFLAVLHGICEHSGSFRNHCLEIVDNNFREIYKFLTEELNPAAVCHDVNLCPAANTVSDENMNLLSGIVWRGPATAGDTRSSAAPFAAEGPLQTVECRLCRTVVQLVQREMDKPEYEHNVEKVLEKVCSLVPGHDRETCGQFVREYANELIKMLADQTDAGVVCALLDLCPKSPAALKNELCPICQYVCHFIQEELEKPEEQRKVEEVVRRVCAIVPKSEKKQCESFINDYAALIISVLSEEMDPSLVCPALNVCPSLRSPADRCAQCQRVMVDLVAALGDDRSERSVANALRAMVPTASANATLTAVQLKVNHREDIVDMMSAEFDAQESCTFLHFCEAPMLSEVYVAGADADTVGVAVEDEETNDVAMETTSPEKPPCALCELVVTMYEKELTSNATEAEVEILLRKFCDKMRNPVFRSDCLHFVDKYVPEVMKLLKEDVKPKDVCRLVKLCPHKMVDVVSGVEERGRCELCEAVLGSLTSLAEDPAKERATMRSLLGICDVFRDTKERATCFSVVSMVGPQLESAALAIPSWYWCTKIHMCPYGAHLTFMDECQNSSQWCVDVKRAVLCDKLTHCQQSVWKSAEPSL